MGQPPLENKKGQPHLVATFSGKIGEAVLAFLETPEWELVRMTRPRSALVSLDVTPYYHCIARCVRRSFFFGIDEKGRDLSYRKPWFLKRLKLLGEVFAINIPAHAVMSNHYHLVLHIDKARSDSWSMEDVIGRWLQLYRGPAVVQRFACGEPLADGELAVVQGLADTWRDRLCSISWFMSCLNYYIALHANREDGCTGHFWEGRFISQALLDDAALLSGMAYVDLNPVRAGIADGLEDADYTSIQTRIRELQNQPDEGKPGLMPFADNARDEHPVMVLPCALQDYLELVDWTGRVQRSDKKGFIDYRTPKILTSLRLSPAQWRLLGKEMQKESATMLNGLNKVACIEKRPVILKSA
jgi:REP element-mobilizing transposase RayT